MTEPRDPIAYHLMAAAAWEATPADTPFSAASLATEGFIHLTRALPDLVEVANAFYRGEVGPHVVLTVRLGLLRSQWRYDGDERYPHVYGPLDREAIAEVRPIARAADGTFLPVDPRTSDG